MNRTVRTLSSLACVLLFGSFSIRSVGAEEVNKYLLISAPRLSKVVYLKVGDTVTKTLIDSGLKSPQGLAIDGKRSKLYVADPDALKVYSFNLLFNNGVLLTDGVQKTVIENYETRWLAVDGVGSIFFTDERGNKIYKLSGDSVLRGEKVPTAIYSGFNVPSVSAPGGIAVDNFNAFWTNKVMGTQVGSVVKGYESPPTSLKEGHYGFDKNNFLSAKMISQNAKKVYGVCLINDNIFYTSQEKYVYGVKKDGGLIATVTNSMDQPRGCAWDQDSTIYVADKGRNAVYSFAGNMQDLGSQHLTKVIDFEDAFGLAVVSGCSQVLPALGVVMLAVSSVLSQ